MVIVSKGRSFFVTFLKQEHIFVKEKKPLAPHGKIVSHVKNMSIKQAMSLIVAQRIQGRQAFILSLK
jgi:hypothetical protein